MRLEYHKETTSEEKGRGVKEQHRQMAKRRRVWCVCRTKR
jgi:hypothetical protein